MTPRRVLLTILLALALVVTVSAIIGAYGEATSRGASDITEPVLPSVPLARELTVSPNVPDTTRRPESGSSPALARGIEVARTAVVGAMVAAQRTVTGAANFADPIHGSEYLAMRLDRGTPVRITGAGGTWTTRTTDYGPAEWTGDIADIALAHFADVCGWTVAEARRRGECPVTVAVGGPVPTLPPTDTP